MNSSENLSTICNSKRKLQLLRSALLALALIAFVYFQIHSCSDDRVTTPVEQGPVADNSVCAADEVFFKDSTLGFVAGMLGTIAMTDDGGQSWSAIAVEAGILKDIHFLDRVHGWIVGKDGAVFSTEDGGISWKGQNAPSTDPGEDYFKVCFLTSDRGYVLGYKGFYITEDGGKSWENYWLPLASDRGALDVSFVDENRGYLLGSRYLQDNPVLVYKTENGGYRWDPVQGSRVSVLRGCMTIWFVDPSIGWAGGAAIYKTGDGGDSWSLQKKPATVREFFFLDAELGFAIGGRTILRTKDGGNIWEDITPALEGTMDLRSVYFLDRSRGWVVGRLEDEKVDDRVFKRSILLSTEDGGDSWEIRMFRYDYTKYASTDDEISP